MAYILHHSTTFSARGTGYRKMDESGQSPVGHAHGHSHVLGGHDNTSVRAAFIHVLGDLLQSIGVMVAAIIIYFWVCLMATFSSHDRDVDEFFFGCFSAFAVVPFRAVSSDLLSISA